MSPKPPPETDAATTEDGSAQLREAGEALQDDNALYGEWGSQLTRSFADDIHMLNRLVKADGRYSDWDPRGAGLVTVEPAWLTVDAHKIRERFPTPQAAQEAYIQAMATGYVNVFTQLTRSEEPAFRFDDYIAQDLFEAANQLAWGLSPHALRLLYGPETPLPELPDKYKAIEAALREKDPTGTWSDIEQVQAKEAELIGRQMQVAMSKYLRSLESRDDGPKPQSGQKPEEWANKVIEYAYAQGFPPVLGAIYRDPQSGGYHFNTAALAELRSTCIDYAEGRARQHEGLTLNDRTL